MDYESYDDLLAVEDYEMYDNTIEDDYGDYDDDAETALDELYEALMDAQESGDLGELMDSFDEKKRRPRKRPARGRTPPIRPLLRQLPSQLPKKGGSCCIDPRVSRDLVTLKQQNAQQDRKLRDIEGLARKNLSVNTLQTKSIGKIHKQMKLDGALDFASSIAMTSSGLEINLAHVLKGAIKSGMLGDPRGALGNPLVIGGLGVLLNNPSILSGLFAPKT